MDVIGSAYVDIRARLTNFDNELRAGIERSMAESSTAFAAGGKQLDRAAVEAESGLKARLAGFVERTGLSDLKREVGRATSAIGIPLSVAIPAAAGIAAVAFTRMAGNFQSQMQLLVSAAGESQSAIKGMGDTTLAIARLTGTSTSDLTSGLYALEKANYRGAAATGVLRVAAEGARAEGANLATVVTGLTSVMASYHVPASQAVNTMNEIIAAAGESKTSMENFSGALSTVIPIASALHVSFAQVAGAMATLTQHGTSAGEATQELSSLLRAFAKPSQVMTNAMQQMGINVVKFQQGLSNPSIGLTGSIQTLVDTVLHHMGPAGLVIVNTMKQSLSASQDLQSMLAQMPPNLAQLAQGFLNGSVGLTDFRKQFRAMGAEGAAQGQQFLSLAQKAKGFNDLIKSGSPAAQTFVGALGHVTGGAIGLNTVLQLSGENMAGFEKRVATVSDAARKGGANIATWGSVQKSFNVTMSRLGETIKTGAISIGADLLPIVSRAATATMDWFQNLGRGGSVFADAKQKFGPLAGVVELIHKAFTISISYITGTVIPVMSNLIRALAPVWDAIKRGATIVLDFANHALHAIGDVLSHYVGPALRAMSKFLADNAGAIAHVIVPALQLGGILLGVALGIKAVGVAAGIAEGVIGGLGGAITTLRILMLALMDGQLVEYLGGITKSTIALTIAEGAQAVVTKAVALATGIWTGAQLLLDAALTAGGVGAFLSEARSLFTMIPIVAAVTNIWTAAQARLDIALDANPIGLLILAIGALVIGIVALVSHFQNLKTAAGDLGHAFGQLFHDVGDVIGAIVKVLAGLFTLNPGKLISGIWDLAKAIVALPVHLITNLGNALSDALGIGSQVILHFNTNSQKFRQAIGLAMLEAKNHTDGLTTSFNLLDTKLRTVSFTSFDDTVSGATNLLKAQAKQMDSLVNTHDKNTITINGHTFALRAFNTAMKESNGDMGKAISLLIDAQTNDGLVHRQLTALTTEQNRFNATIKGASDALGISTDDVNKYGNFMAISARDVATGRISQLGFNNAIETGRYALDNTTGRVGTFVTQLFQYQNSAKTASDATDLFKAALDALAGNSQDVNTAIAQANQQVTDLAASVKGAADPSHKLSTQLFNVKTGAVNLTGAGGQLQIGLSQLKSQLENVASATYQNEVGTKGQTAATADATAAYQKMANQALASLQSQLHLTNPQVAELAKQLQITPENKKILLSIPNLSQTTGGVTTLLNDLNALHSKTIGVTVVSTTVSPGHNVVTRREAMGGIVRFAGGSENHLAQIAHAGDWRLWAEPETGGEAYIPLGSGKRSDSIRILEQVARIFGGVFVPPTDMTNIRIKTYATGGFEFGGHTYRTAASLHNAEAAASRSHASMIIHISRDDLTALMNAVNGSAKTILSVGNRIGTALALDALHGVGNSEMVHVIDAETHKLAGLASARETVASRLKTANATLSNLEKAYASEWSKVYHNTLGTFDITTAGNFNGYATISSVMAGLSAQAAQVSTFSKNLDRVKKLGLNTSLLQQLSEAGPASSGTLGALAGATPAQVAQINAMYAHVKSVSSGIGSATASAMYGAGIKAADGLVRGLKSQMATISRTMTSIADLMVAQIKKDLGIHSPSVVGHTIGAFFGQGMANGVRSLAGDVSYAASMLSRAAVGGAGASAGRVAGGTSVVIHNHVQASLGMNETMLADRIAAKQAAQVRYGSPVPLATPSHQSAANISPALGRG